MNKLKCEHKWEVDGNFRYCDPCHTYELDGKPLSGVTTIIKEAFPPPLHWWASGMALEPMGWTNPKYVSREEGEKKAEEFIKTLWVKTAEPQLWYDFLQTCYKAHNEFKKTRGKEGTDTHALVETYINNCIKNSDGQPMTPNPVNTKEVIDFANWAMDNVDKFLATEKKVYSEKNWFAGTLDFLFEKDSKTYVGDIKTSKTIYPEHFIQCGAYQVALAEQGIETVGSVVVKLNGKLESKWSYDTARDRKIFLFALESVRLKRTFN